MTADYILYFYKGELGFQVGDKTMWFGACDEDFVWTTDIGDIRRAVLTGDTNAKMGIVVEQSLTWHRDLKIAEFSGVYYNGDYYFQSVVSDIAQNITSWEKAREIWGLFEDLDVDIHATIGGDE